MMTLLIFVSISLALFISYNIASLHLFGVPSSLSNTYYLYDLKKKGLGFLFPAMMGSMGFTLLPAWLELGEVISAWSAYLNPLAFFTCAAICFVGAAPAFKANILQGKVHTIAAYIAAACAVLWCFVVCWKIMYVPIAVAGLIALIAWLTKTFKSGLVYWLEMMAFGSTFTTIITQLLIL